MIYSGQLSGQERTTFAAGTLTLDCTFTWPDEIQEQYDKWQMLVDTMAKSGASPDPYIMKIIDVLKEFLRYTCVINDNTVISVIPGGWTSGPDNAWRIRFTSPRNTIDRESLQYVTVEVDDGTD